VVDLAKGHISSLKKMHELKGFVVYNLGTGNGTSVLELVSAFEKVSGVKIPIVNCPRREGDVAKLLAIPTKANKELGWKTELTIEDMCRDSYNWVKKNPDGYEL
jgi:UDP-glucose 4-epimerase